MLNKIIGARKLIHIILATAVLASMHFFHIKLLTIIIFGSLLGILLGKTFCRWMCPVGVFMGFLIGGKSNEKFAQQYNYFKIGCPISWVSGFLNRFSLFKVQKKPELCIDCGKCDDVCYITEFDDNCSLYKDDKYNASMESSCSRCLECIKACPTSSLKTNPKNTIHPGSTVAAF